MRQTCTMARRVTLRGLSGSSLLVSPHWRALVSELNSGLKATITLLGAGTLGAYIMAKYVSKLLTVKNPTVALKLEPTSSVPVEQFLTIPGLQNTGNNCFLNVILQALASSEVLLNFMDACAALTSKIEHSSEEKATKGKVTMPLAIAVSSLIKDLSQLENAQRTSSPRRVMLALRLYVQHFDLDAQQDAAEALIYLASALQEERGKYLEWLRPTLQSFFRAPALHEADSVKGGRNGFNGMKGGDQLLDSWRGRLPWPLEGTIASSLTCQRCGYQFSTQFQSFNDITLTPLCDRERNMIRGCSLESYLDQFTRPEWVESVKCRNCSHKAALSSISDSGESRLAAVADARNGNHKVSRSKVTRIEECVCDEDCKCEGITIEEGGTWRNIYTNASKQLKIGRSPQVICFQIQRVIMSHDGAMKKLTGHVNFPRILDLFPYTVAAKDSIPLIGHIGRNNFQDLSFSKERPSSSSHPPFTTDGVFLDMHSSLHSEVSCKGGADLRAIAAEDRKTIDSDGKEGGRDNSSARKGETGSEQMGSTCITASASLSNLDLIYRGSDSLSTERLNKNGHRSKKFEDSTLPSLSADFATQDEPQKDDHPVDNTYMVVAGTQRAKNEEPTAQRNSHSLDKQTSSSDETLVSEQVSNRHGELIEEFVSVRHSSPKTGGISSNVVQSIYAQYIPRVFPPIHHQLSSFATPYESQQLSADLYVNLKKLPGVHSLPMMTPSLRPKNSKYSKKLLYQLISVVVHQGGPQNGHYLVYRKVRIRGSRRNPTGDDSVVPTEPIDYEGSDEKPNVNSAGSSPVSDEQLAMTLSTEEGGKVQADVSQQFEVENLLDITSSKRIKPSRSRVQVSGDEDLFRCESPNDISLAEKFEAQRTSGSFSGECTNCTGICGKRKDADALWFRISDTNVQRVLAQEVFSAQASLLFYEQL